jgi:hypothetical protein
MASDTWFIVAVLGLMFFGLVGLLGSFCRIVSLDSRGMTLSSAFGRRFREWSEISKPVERYNGILFWVLLLGPSRHRLFPFAWAVPLFKSDRSKRLIAEISEHAKVVDVRNLGDLLKAR